MIVLIFFLQEAPKYEAPKYEAHKNEASKNKTDSPSYKDIAEIPEDYNVPGMRSAAAIASTPEKDKIQQYKVIKSAVIWTYTETKVS